MKHKPTNLSAPLSAGPPSVTKHAVFEVISSGTKISSLTAPQLEQWLASISKPSKHKDSYLANRLLAHFGIKDAHELMTYFKSPSGKLALKILGEEFAKLVAQKEYLARHYAEELARHRSLIYLLMGLINKRKAQAKHLNEIIQEQIDKKRGENKRVDSSSSEKKRDMINMELLDEAILNYKKSIEALDKKIEETKEELAVLDKELINLKKQGKEIKRRYDVVDDHVAQLDDYLKLLASGSLPMSPTPAQANQINAQIATLAMQLAALQSQPAKMPTNDSTSKALTPPLTQTQVSYKEIKVKQLEERIAFHQARLSQPAQDIEQLIHQKLQQLDAKIKQRQSNIEHIYEDRRNTEQRPLQYELEGVKVLSRGLSDALAFHRKEKILLNENLEPVYNFDEARFILSPSQQKKLVKVGDSYALIVEGQDLDNMNDEAWLEAKQNYERAKPEIIEARVLARETRRNEESTHAFRQQKTQSLRNSKAQQVNDIYINKAQLVDGLANASKMKELLTRSAKVTAKSEPGGSYALMMQRLAPPKGPAPRQQEINQAKARLKEVVEPKRYNELDRLISEVQPGKLMPEQKRLSWLQRAFSLIPTSVEPGPETTSKTFRR